MKRIFIILLLTILLITSTMGCSDKVINSELYSNNDKEKIGQLNVSVDKRIEILSIIQYLSKFPSKDRMISNRDSEYKKDIEEFFLKHKNHPVIKEFETLAVGGFLYHVPPWLMLYVSSDTFDIKDYRVIDKEVINRSGGKGSIKDFIRELKSFKKESNFDDFYNDHLEFYSKQTLNIKNMLDDTKAIDRLREYFGYNQNSYNIIISPLNAGGYGIRIPSNNKLLDVYSIIPPIEDKMELTSFVWHEFGHSYVNPLTKENIKYINRYRSLFDPISEEMSKMAYPIWEVSVNEHIIRSITSRLSSKYFGEDRGVSEKDRNKARGFHYIDSLYDRFNEYENNRDKYKDFREFYPRIIDVFKELSQMDLGKDFYNIKFDGTINTVIKLDGPKVYIIPTNEESEEIEEDIKEYVTKIRNLFFKDAKIITDKKALETDLSNSNIFAYGTLNGNLWLKNNMVNIPFKIEGDRITADKIYEGTSLRYITAWPKKDNDKRGMVIYLAQRGEDIVGINSIMHGSTGYVIAHDKVITSGNYLKGDSGLAYK